MSQKLRSSIATEKLEKLELGKTTPIKTLVWRVRTKVRNLLRGKDPLDVQTKPEGSGEKVRHIYRKVDAFMARYFPELLKTTPKNVALGRVQDVIKELGFTIVEKDLKKPWGGYFRISNADAGRFINEFFPGLTLHEAKLENDELELSPKILLVTPKHRLSWQYHYRRAERWRFLTPGAYRKSMTDKESKRIEVKPGDVVQFTKGERHRLEGRSDGYVLVAEIWQHTNPQNPSDESDIVRLADDYKR